MVLINVVNYALRNVMLVMLPGEGFLGIRSVRRMLGTQRRRVLIRSFLRREGSLINKKVLLS
jgi:hypothetical protein